ncbi:MAG: carbon starvation CstA family protein [Bacteroidales bacterium]|nr:carbon starvation CstA family protein [Bacteroidales bacterium]
MITFFVSIAFLLLGYYIYGRFLERVFGVNTNLATPAITMADGVDYVPLGWGKIFLIQFLNIAGLGPIFGAVLGAMFGPVAFLWIVFGNIFGGAMHDFFSGMLSVRNNGLSITEIVSNLLGKRIKILISIFTFFLMVLVGAVFVMGPAGIIQNMTNGMFNITFWIGIIFVYYFVATIFPVDKIIGKIYPIFGFALLFMAVGIFVMMLWKGLPIPELTSGNWNNFHHKGSAFPVFPMMFVTIACGAISGFHATQSPLMARCIKNEKFGRRVFYGAMISEGVVALIWAAVGMAFWGGVKELNSVMIENNSNAAWGVNEIANSLLGKVGGILALLGVVAAPITSADTAFRSARLITADFLKIAQKPFKNRLLISIPIFIIGFIISQTNFGILWRYMAWSNQTLATIVLWAITWYLAKEKKMYVIALIPAIFMTAVCSTYIFISPEGLSWPQNISYLIGGAMTLLFTLLFFYKLHFLGKS